MQSTLAVEISGNSLWHRMDARLKLIGVFINLVLLSLLAPGHAAIAFAISLLFLLSARIPVQRWMKQMFQVFWFLLLFVAVLPWSVGSADWYFGTSQRGVWLAAGIFCKGMCATAWILFLTGTTSIEDLLHAASKLGLPRPILRVLIVTWHYVQVMSRTLENFRVTLRLRGFRNRTNWKTYQTLANVVGTLFVHGYDRTERLVQAMHLRGYKGVVVSLDDHRVKRIEWLYLGILIQANGLLCIFTKFLS